MEEMLDICDGTGNPTGKTVTRSEAHLRGIPHRSAHIWIVRGGTSDTEVLLQKRSLCKDSFPGKWDTSSAGHVPAGESPLTAAHRELREELGLFDVHLEWIGRMSISTNDIFHGKAFINNETAFVYICRDHVEIDSLLPDRSEVEAVQWFHLKDVMARCLQGDEDYCVTEKGLRVLLDHLNSSSSPIL